MPLHRHAMPTCFGGVGRSPFTYGIHQQWLFCSAHVLCPCDMPVCLSRRVGPARKGDVVRHPCAGGTYELWLFCNAHMLCPCAVSDFFVAYQEVAAVLQGVLAAMPLAASGVCPSAVLASSACVLCRYCEAPLCWWRLSLEAVLQSSCVMLPCYAGIARRPCAGGIHQ